ncbi:hypothetical protein BC833DRAFT_581310 [Globomyces pollinis-pini]|nr:hypothetical protein BC833DRAFT_581310 [Globomyces pollinis-pini]
MSSVSLVEESNGIDMSNLMTLNSTVMNSMQPRRLTFDPTQWIPMESLQPSSNYQSHPSYHHGRSQRHQHLDTQEQHRNTSEMSNQHQSGLNTLQRSLSQNSGNQMDLHQQTPHVHIDLIEQIRLLEEAQAELEAARNELMNALMGWETEMEEEQQDTTADVSLTHAESVIARARVLINQTEETDHHIHYHGSWRETQEIDEGEYEMNEYEFGRIVNDSDVDNEELREFEESFELETRGLGLRLNRPVSRLGRHTDHNDFMMDSCEFQVENLTSMFLDANGMPCENLEDCLERAVGWMCQTDNNNYGLDSNGNSISSSPDGSVIDLHCEKTIRIPDSTLPDIRSVGR